MNDGEKCCQVTFTLPNCVPSQLMTLMSLNSGKEFSIFSMKITDLYFLFYFFFFFFSNNKHLRILNFSCGKLFFFSLCHVFLPSHLSLYFICWGGKIT